MNGIRRPGTAAMALMILATVEQSDESLRAVDRMP